jgi:hypothetical protein
VVYPDVDCFALFEPQAPGIFAGYLGPEAAPVFEGHLDADLETEVDELSTVASEVEPLGFVWISMSCGRKVSPSLFAGPIKLMTNSLAGF